MQGITEVLQKEFQRAFPKAEKRDSRLWTGLGTGPENRVSGLGDKAQGRRDKGQKAILSSYVIFFMRIFEHFAQ